MHAFSSLWNLQKFYSLWKSTPITGSSGWFWGEMKRWVAKAKVILWFWRKTKGIKEPLAFVERIADIYRNVKFDRVILTFVSKILGRFSSVPKLYCSWKLWAKVNYKQLHLATKSIWGFNPILEQIAWKCKIDCLQGEGGWFDIKCRFCSKFSGCSSFPLFLPESNAICLSFSAPLLSKLISHKLSLFQMLTFQLFKRFPL